MNQRGDSNGDGRVSSTAGNLANSAVLLKSPIVYGCINCGQHLFDSSAMVQRQIEIDDHSFGLIVDSLFNVGDLTMGPTVCKTFLNGMFKVREVYCDGCLGTFGWKIIESFDEWVCSLSLSLSLCILNEQKDKTLSHSPICIAFVCI